MLSIITPTHNEKYLKELEESILAQTFSEWEWIILLNNGAHYQSTDSRIKVHHTKQKSVSVGALKKEACSLCNSEIIVEVDHDDLLTPDCLAELEKAYRDPEIGFVYSDNAKLSATFKPYDSKFGWTHSKFNFRGQSLYVMNSQPLYPGRLGYIWFSPDHVRSWRKTVYDQIGGHNPELTICDDQDLMCRLYLVTKFHYIPKTLYIYRIDGTNTWLERNALIQKTTVELYNKYIYQLATRFSDLNDLKKIDLCGGINPVEGYISIDKFNGDIIADLDEGIPLPDNSCGVIRAHDALEHIKDKVKIMKEIHRVLAPGGILLSMTPSTDGRGAFQDPTHVSFYNENSFWYYTREQAKYIGMKPIFRECALFTYFPSEWFKENHISYVKADLEVLK